MAAYSANDRRLHRSLFGATFLLSFLVLVGPIVVQASPSEPPTETEVAMEPDTMNQASAVGFWKGEIQVPGQPLGVLISIEEGDGGLVGTADIPTQGIRDLPLKDVEQDGAVVRFTLSKIPGSPTFDGKVEGSFLKGDFRQAGAQFPFELERAEPEVSAPPARPQTPEPPFPYASEDVSITHGEITLAGTLTLPAGQGPFPAVALLTGSGPQDRDSTVFEHKPFLVLADHLTRAGIAVLRFDDRGHAESTGDRAVATGSDFADDALAVVGFLTGRDEIDAERVGLVGHSEGGTVALVAAARSDTVRFVVSLAGPSVSGVEVLPAQAEAIAVAGGAPAMAAGMQAQIYRKTLEKVVAAESPEAARELLLSEGRTQLLAAKGAQGQEAEISDDEEGTILEQAAALTSPWMLHFLKYDPAEALAEIDVPVLALNGSLDLQVLPDQNLPPFREAFAASGHGDATVEALDGLNHLFQPTETGSPSEYFEIETTLDPVLLDRVTAWILERFGSAASNGD